jgi:hypothetical protein
MDWIRICLSPRAALFRTRRMGADLNKEPRAHNDFADPL